MSTLTPREYKHTPAQIVQMLRIDDNGQIWWKTHKGRRDLNKPVGCLDTSTGYLVVRIDYQNYKLHSIAWVLYYGEWPAKQQVVDHVNHIRTDNKKANLRLVPTARNGYNRKRANSNSLSKIRGVHWCNTFNKWRVEATIDGVYHSGGYFHSYDAAIAVSSLLHTVCGEDKCKTLKL